MEFISQIINQVFDIQNKLQQDGSITKIERNLNRLNDIFAECGYIIQNPLGEKYNDSRADIEASIVGDISKNMKVSQVLKPVIYSKNNGNLQLLQKGVVMVEAEK